MVLGGATKNAAARSPLLAVGFALTATGQSCMARGENRRVCPSRGSTAMCPDAVKRKAFSYQRAAGSSVVLVLRLQQRSSQTAAA
jgi:hypothetical protein